MKSSVVVYQIVLVALVGEAVVICELFFVGLILVIIVSVLELLMLAGVL